MAHLRVGLIGCGTIATSAHVPALERLRSIVRVLGPVLAHLTRELKLATGAERVYVYVFGGGVPHLHLHLAPHHRDGALNTQMLRGEVEVRPLPSGATMYVSRDFPPLPEA